MATADIFLRARDAAARGATGSPGAECAEPPVSSSASGPSGDEAALRALVAAQRRELSCQGAQLAEKHAQLASAETERVQLARQLGVLDAEREQLAANLSASATQLARLNQIHTQERKDDTSLFQENLQRLLSEKARLLEEVEEATKQKDVLTEALVHANGQLGHAARLSEELATWKAQHAEATERLQRALSERDGAKASAAALTKQLEAARGALGSHAQGVERLRAELDASSAQAAALATKGRREARDRAALARELRDVESAWRSAADGADAADALLRCQVATCVASLAECEHGAEAASSLARRKSDAAAAASAEARAAQAALVEVREARDDAAKRTSVDHHETSRQLGALAAERDGALAELASAKRVAESLRLELKKAMRSASAAAPAAGCNFE